MVFPAAKPVRISLRLYIVSECRVVLLKGLQHMGVYSYLYQNVVFVIIV